MKRTSCLLGICFIANAIADQTQMLVMMSSSAISEYRKMKQFTYEGRSVLAGPMTLSLASWMDFVWESRGSPTPVVRLAGSSVFGELVEVWNEILNGHELHEYLFHEHLLSEDARANMVRRLEPHLVTYMTMYPLILEEQNGSGDHSSLFCRNLVFATKVIETLLSPSYPARYRHFWDSRAVGVLSAKCPLLVSAEFRLESMLELVRELPYFNLNRLPSGVMNHRVDRKNVLPGAYRLFQELDTGEELRTRELRISFVGEMGLDAGGLKREWYRLVTQELFNPAYGLFEETEPGSNKFKPNPLSGIINPEHHSDYFRFAGQFVARAICDRHPIPAYFTRHFYRQILSGGRAPVVVGDYEDEAPLHFRNLQALLSPDVPDEVLLDLTFTADVFELGKLKQVELLPGGAGVAVDQSNKEQYVQLLIEHKLRLSVELQMKAFLEGFYSVLPHRLISNKFRPQELAIVIAGSPDINVEDLAQHTMYDRCSFESPQIVWFWNVVRAFSRRHLVLLLTFVTGSSQVPLGGFANLRQGGSGEHGPFVITLMSGASNVLPSAHTCFNQIVLPEYTSQEELAVKLVLAIEDGQDSFGYI